MSTEGRGEQRGWQRRALCGAADLWVRSRGFGRWRVRLPRVGSGCRGVRQDRWAAPRPRALAEELRSAAAASGAAAARERSRHGAGRCGLGGGLGGVPLAVHAPHGGRVLSKDVEAALWHGVRESMSCGRRRTVSVSRLPAEDADGLAQNCHPIALLRDVGVKHKQRRHPEARSPSRLLHARAEPGSRAPTTRAPLSTSLKDDALDVSLKMSRTPLYQHLGRRWRLRKSRRRTTEQRSAFEVRPGQECLQVGIQPHPSAWTKGSAPLRRQLTTPGSETTPDDVARAAAADAEHRQANNRRVYRPMTMPEIYGAYFAGADAKKNNLMDFLTDAEDEGSSSTRSDPKLQPEAVVYDFKAKVDVPWNARKMQPGVKEVRMGETRRAATRTKSGWIVAHRRTASPTTRTYRLQEYNKHSSALPREQVAARLPPDLPHDRGGAERASGGAARVSFGGDGLQTAHDRPSVPAQDKHLSGTRRAEQRTRHRPRRIGACARESTARTPSSLLTSTRKVEADEARLKDPCFIGGKRQKGCFSWNAFTSTSTDIDKSMEFAKCKRRSRRLLHLSR